MAKLKCDKHNRRVLTLNGVFAHRTGDLSDCNSISATIGDRKFFLLGGGLIAKAGASDISPNY